MAFDDKVYYHGTNTAFHDFYNHIMYFTDDPLIASEYSVNGFFIESKPNVRPVHLDLGNTLTMNEQDIEKLLGPPELSRWDKGFEAFLYTMNDKGYDSVSLINVIDYSGTEIVDGKKRPTTKPYNQFVIFGNHQVRSIFDVSRET